MERSALPSASLGISRVGAIAVSARNSAKHPFYVSRGHGLKFTFWELWGVSAELRKKAPI